MGFDSSVPFLLFTFHTKIHKLQNSKYLKPLNKVTEKLHEEIFRLKSLGLGYRKIHKKLVEKGYRSVRTKSILKPNFIFSIYNKGKLREDRLKRKYKSTVKDIQCLVFDL